MKKLILCTGLIFILGTLGFGQKQKGTPEIQEVPSDKKVSPGRSVSLDAGTRIDGQLQTAVDAKRSKVGDPVVLKTTKSIKQGGETIIPKGSNLIGRITEVQQKSKSNGESRLGIVFDRIEGKNLSAPISASITSITSAAASGRAGDTAGADVFGSSTSSTRTSGGGSGAGGLLGGVTGTAGGVLNTTTQTVGGVTNDVGQTVGSTVGSVGQTVNGIQITNAVSGSAMSATTLTAADKNVRLEKGVIIQVQLSSSVRSQ